MKQSGIRIGLMVPVNNTTMESEMLAWLPENSTCRTLRIARGKSTLTPADLPVGVVLDQGHGLAGPTGGRGGANR